MDIFKNLFINCGSCARAGDIAILLLVLYLCYALVDKYFPRYFKLDLQSGIEKFVFFEGLGLGILSLLILLLGFVGFLYAWVFILLGIIAVVIVRDRFSLNLRYRLPSLNLLEVSLLGLLLVFILSALLSALCPPTSVDEMMYHLAIPKLFAGEHRIFNAADNMRSAWVMSQEMLFTLGYVLKGEILAKLFHFAMGMLTMLAVYSFSRKIMPRPAALFAPLIFIATPIVFWLTTIGNNDLTLAYFSFLALYAASNWFSLRDDCWLLMSGVFCGFAMGTKYIGMLSVLAILLAVISYCVLNKKRVPLKAVLMSGLTAAAVGCIWYVRNYIYLGDPVFPFLNNIFLSKYWYTQYYYMDLAHFGMGKGFIDLLLLPWNLTFHCLYFTRIGYIGPVYLMCLSLFILMINKFRPDRSISLLVLFSAFFFLFWALSSQYARYLSPLFPVLCVLSAYVIHNLSHIFSGLQRSIVILTLIIAIFLELPFFTPLWVDSKHWGRYTYTISYADFAHSENFKLFSLAGKYVFGSMTRDEYLSTHGATAITYPLISYANKNLPPDAKIFVVYDFLRCYFNGNIRTDYDYFPEFGMSFHDLFADPERQFYPGMWTNDFYMKLKRSGFTHMLINYVNLERSGNSASADRRFLDFAGHRLELIKATSGGALCRIL